MKILAYVAGGFLVIILAALGFIFSSAGNAVIASYAKDIALKNAGVQLEFSKFELGFSSLDTIFKVNGELTASVWGDLSLFTQSLNLSYKIDATDLKSANLKLSEPINLSGQLKGKFKDFDANGAGKAFGSNLSFIARITDYRPFTLQLNAKSLQIAELLAALGKPAYASGQADITADIKEQNNIRAGVAEILLYDGLANSDLIAHDFNLTLPANFTLKGAVNAAINGDNITAKSLFDTPVATAKTSQTNYDITTGKLISDFALDAPDLSKFEPIIKQKLTGSLKAVGNVAFAQNRLENLMATIDGLGGQINANLKDGKLTAKIDNIKLNELLNLAAQPAYASANIDGSAILENLTDTKNIKGSINLATTDGKLNAAVLKKSANLNLANDLNFSLKFSSDVANSLAKFNANLASELLNLEGVSGEYNTQNGALSSKFALIANDLGKFESLLGLKLSGELNLNGDVKAKNGKIFELLANGKALGGALDLLVKGENLRASLKNGSLKDTFLLAGLDPLASGTLNLKASLSPLDLKNLGGEVKIELTDGEIYEKAASKISGKNFPADVKFSLNSDILLEKSVANFTAVLASSLLNLPQTSGKFDLNSGVLTAKFQANIPELAKLKFLTERELKGPLEITGEILKQGTGLEINANSKLFNGATAAKFKNGLLNATITDFTFKALSDTLQIDHVYDGVGDGKFSYDTGTKRGEFNINIKEGKLVANGLTNAIKTFTTRDITTEIYKNGYVRGTIDKTLIKFNTQMSAQRSDINATAATFDTASKAMNIPLEVRYEKTDAKITITGTKDAPKYSISSNYLRQKASDKIDKFLDRELGGENNATKDAVKWLLKGLF